MIFKSIIYIYIYICGLQLPRELHRSTRLLQLTGKCIWNDNYRIVQIPRSSTFWRSDAERRWKNWQGFLCGDNSLGQKNTFLTSYSFQRYLTYFLFQKKRLTTSIRSFELCQVCPQVCPVGGFIQTPSLKQNVMEDWISEYIPINTSLRIETHKNSRKNK